ncbi:MAG: hypothetical protein QNJ55_36580 [Xenococcus sp. MO_188.B8]|nr:hypothetical protein [Xenococcus sp. MO_188.B8]
MSGNWHIAWQAPLNGISWATLGYYIPVFVAPVIYGSWKFTLYHIIVGPLLARILTNNINEWPAVWCLLSIGLFLIVIKTPIRQILYTKRWWFWDSEELESPLNIDEINQGSTKEVAVAGQLTTEDN